MNYEDILKAQEGLKTLSVKGKDYVTVTERVKAFRKLYPDGFIKTDIEDLNDGRVVVKARVGYTKETPSGYADDFVLATGIACEKEGSSMINKTSFIENCETSAVGRALGFLGIGIDGGIASAEEVQNAVEAQKGLEPIGKIKAKALAERCNRMRVSLDDLMTKFKVDKLEDLTEAQHSRINLWLINEEGKK